MVKEKKMEKTTNTWVYIAMDPELKEFSLGDLKVRATDMMESLTPTTNSMEKVFDLI